MLDSLRAARPFLVQKPLPLAAVKVSPQIDQGVDHLLAALLELRQGDRRRGLSGEEGESPLLGRRVPVGAGHCEQAEGPSRRFQGLGAREAEGAGRRLGALRNGEDALDLLGREPLDGVGRPGEDPLVLTVLLHDGDVSYRRPRQVEGDGQGGLGDLRYGLEPRELRRGARNLFEDVAVHRVQACRFHGVLPPLLRSATRLNTSLLPCVARRRNSFTAYSWVLSAPLALQGEEAAAGCFSGASLEGWEQDGHRSVRRKPGSAVLEPAAAFSNRDGFPPHPPASQRYGGAVPGPAGRGHGGPGPGPRPDPSAARPAGPQPQPPRAVRTRGGARPR